MNKTSERESIRLKFEFKLENETAIKHTNYSSQLSFVKSWTKYCKHALITVSEMDGVYETFLLRTKFINDTFELPVFSSCSELKE